MDPQKRVHIDLTVVHEGGRRMDPAPNGVSVGATHLRSWQVDRIDTPVNMFDGYDAHLIKINYDLEIDSDCPGMPWFEISFEFLSWETGDQAVVIDALPRFGTSPEASRPYVLNRFLNFVPSESDASAQVLLPASTDRVDMFGAGGSSVRWRHVSLSETGVRPGSYAAWVVLLTPAEQVEQRVECSARYDLSFLPDAEYRPTQVPVVFRLSLAASRDGLGGMTPSLSAATEGPSQEYQPSVFICYAHDSPRHKETAHQFGDLLVRNGVDVHMDRYAEGKRGDWAIWARKLIDQVDFVIVLASPICRKAFDGELQGLEHPGIRSESRLINERLHVYRDEWTAKVLPVVLPHELVDNIPEMLQPWTSDHYDVTQLTPEGIDELLRAMTGVPKCPRPPLGQLPAAVLKPLSGTES
ncbi:toll/interleukin-1 receptor domain-containing protein [Streptomyces samsunensis]|uniref:toll/interleukin-1 receptor domain-containing protein n=1 Tax=Streptomyces malaysiensis TaxID=92644 RepID=UPI0015821802|nr:toll/interleukin-1 receptor domain-containing protein [Streptomyces samsunensis]NUH36432.1 toll/interleukin-1 receptor domain-containing protein [Streptomyces samsunensis]